jgi:hypothetical protein
MKLAKLPNPFSGVTPTGLWWLPRVKTGGHFLGYESFWLEGAWAEP